MPLADHLSEILFLNNPCYESFNSLPCELWTNLPIMAYLSNFLAILLSYSLLSSSIFDNYFHENSAETATPPPLLLYQSCRLSLCLNANYSVMANRCLGVCIFYFGVCIFKNRVCKIQRGFANFKRGLQTCCQELIFRDSCNRNPPLGFVSPKGG